ncbi:hypothetical protein [Streptomyces sp. sk226]|nr:hypothetical protein [Streptomyces sp. sk226]
MGAVLAGAWALRNLLTLFLLGALAGQHMAPEGHPSHLVDWSAPDQEVTG